MIKATHNDKASAHGKHVICIILFLYLLRELSDNYRGQGYTIVQISLLVQGDFIYEMNWK